MDNYIREATNNTPCIRIDRTTGIIEFKGVSIPEDPLEFYKPIQDWLSSVFKQAIPPKIEVTVEMEYFNSSSLKCLIDIFKKLVELKKSGNTQLTFNWYYSKDDEDMHEAGNDCAYVIGYPFNCIELK